MAVSGASLILWYLKLGVVTALFIAPLLRGSKSSRDGPCTWALMNGSAAQKVFFFIKLWEHLGESIRSMKFDLYASVYCPSVAVWGGT